MFNWLAAISAAALSVVHGGIVTHGAVPAVTFHRDNHAKRATMGYASAAARLRRAVLEAKSAAWDEEEVGWEKQDEEAALKAQTAARELLAYAETTLSSPEEQKSSEPSLRGAALAANHSQIDHPVYQVGSFGLKSKLLEVETPDSSDDEGVDEPHPYVHYNKIIRMAADARNEITAAKWDEDHENQKDSTVKDEGKKVVFAAGKLVSVLAQVISWAKAHQEAEAAEAAASKPSVAKVATSAAPTRALTVHSNSSTTVVKANTTKISTNVTAADKTTVSANKTAMNADTKVAAASNQTSTTTTTTTPAAKASNGTNVSSPVDIENEATNQAEVVESSAKKISAAVKELDAATNEIRKDDPAVEDVMSELDKAAGKLEGSQTRISLKIIAHKLVQDSQKKVKDEMQKKTKDETPKAETPVSNVSTSAQKTVANTSSAQENATVQKENATAMAPKFNATEQRPEASKHEVKVTVNVTVPKSLVKQSPPVKKKSPEEQMDDLLAAEAKKQEAADEKQEDEQAKAQAAREKQEAVELKSEEDEIENEQQIEAEKEAEEKKQAANQLEQEEKDAEEEMEAEKEERKAKALMRLAKKRRAKLHKF